MTSCKVAYFDVGIDIRDRSFVSTSESKKLRKPSVRAPRVFIGGASQGCCTALHCALQFPQKLGGFVGVVGHQP